MAGGKVVVIKSKAEWETHKSSGKTLIVDFTATWCGPCNAIGPYFTQLSDLHDSIVFVKIDVDEQSDIAAEAGVSAMPTFQVYKDGGKVEELVGGHKEKLKNLVEKYATATVAA